MHADRPLQVLHTADWHLGRTLGDQPRDEEHAAFLAWLLDLIASRRIDVLVIAGDVFDSPNPPHQASEMYFRFLAELHAASDCHVVVVGGNHDSPRHLEAAAPLLLNHRVRVIGAMPEDASAVAVVLPDRSRPRLVVAAVPFLRDRDVRLGKIGESIDEIAAAMRAGIARRYAEAWEHCVPHRRGVPVIATGHLTIVGGQASDSERLVHIGGLGAVAADAFTDNFAYVALGHLHRGQAMNQAGTVRYSGSPIPLSFSEAADEKAVRLLTFEGEQMVAQESIPVPLHRRLVRLMCEAAEAAQAIGSYSWPDCPAGCFVELTVRGAAAGAVDVRSLRGLLEGTPHSLLQVAVEGAGRSYSLSSADAPAGGAAAGDAIRQLRSEPRSVFAARLGREEALAAEDRAALAAEFDAVLESLEQEAAAPAVRGKPKKAKRPGDAAAGESGDPAPGAPA